MSDPRELAELLGVDIANPTATNGNSRPSAGTVTDTPAAPVNLERFPKVRAAVERVTGDRSEDTYRIAAACHAAKLTLGEMRTIVHSRADLRGRLQERKDDDLLAVWLKLDDEQRTTERVFSSPPPEPGALPQHPRSEGVTRIACCASILDEVAKTVRSRGLVGEERLVRTLYLVLTSRLLDKPVSAGVKGHSASGKSHTVDSVVALFPEESYLTFTAMSERALVYSDDEYSHRTIIVYELTALREGQEDDQTSYFIRTLLSEGRIDYEVTVKDKDGGFTTKRITKEGPTNMIFTTTQTKVHSENETRILSLATDDSSEQTVRVLLALADETHGGDDDLEDWRGFQRWLAGAEHRVVIPYGRQLAQLVPPAAVRIRRDFRTVLAMIRTHAMLHQESRDKDDDGRIVATIDDYAVVRDLVGNTIAEGVDRTASDTVRKTAEAVAASATGAGATVKEIADRLNVDKSNASRRLRVAADKGYVRNLETKRGMPARWVIGDALPDGSDLLPDPAQLLEPDAQPSDLQCCGNAPVSGGGKEKAGQPPEDPTCEVCGNELWSPQSQARGLCEACHLGQKQQTQNVSEWSA